MFKIILRNTLILFLSLTAAFAIAQPDQPYQLHFYNGQQAYSEDLVSANFSNGLTFEGWFYIDSATTTNTLIGYGEVDSNNGSLVRNNSHSLSLDNNNLLNASLRIKNSSGVDSRTTSSSTAVPLDSWVHLAVSYDNQSIKLYINGSLAGNNGSIVGSIAQLEGRFQIGHLFNDGFRGFARDIRVWGKGLSGSEITTVSQSTVDSDASNLIANWQLNSSSGSVELDRVAGARLFLGLEEATENPRSEPDWGLSNPFYSIRDDYVENVEQALESEFIGIVDASGVGDFNNDGFQDFLYIGFESTTELTEVPFRFFLNDGTGRFTESTSQVIDGEIPKAQWPGARFLIVADLNGDGLDDVFSANSGFDGGDKAGEENTLLLSDSSTGKLQNIAGNRFGPPCTSTIPAFDSQLACGQSNSQLLYPDINAEHAHPRVGFGHGATAADIDNDGDLDIYVNNVYGGSNTKTAPYFLINDGTGNFLVSWENAPILASTASPIRAKASSKLFDMDGDGYVDLILGSHGYSLIHGGDGGASYIVWGDGTGNYNHDTYLEIPLIDGFSNIPGVPLPIDIDNDGDMDLILPRTSDMYVGRYLQVLKNKGNRTFDDVTSTALFSQNTTGDWVAETHALDIDGNGCDDILLNMQQYSRVQTESIWLSDCLGKFTLLPDSVLGKLGFRIPIDAHNDGDLDFVVAQRRIKNYGDNPYGQIIDFTLLEKVRPIDLTEIFDASACIITLNCTEPENINVNSAGLDVATGELLIPVLDINGTKYQIYLTLIPDTNPVRLQVDLGRVAQLSSTEPGNHATFDGVNLTIPRLSVTLDDVPSVYSLVLRLVSAEPVVFELAAAELL